MKEYRESNRNAIRESQKQYYEQNKDGMKLCVRKHYEQNKDAKKFSVQHHLIQDNCGSCNPVLVMFLREWNFSIELLCLTMYVFPSTIFYSK